jgi:hypothetical protein
VRHPISCPPLRQEQRIQRDCKRRRVFSTTWQQAVEKTLVTGRLVPPGLFSVPQPHRVQRRITDGRHLGCSGPRASSRKHGRCGPGPGCVRASDTSWRWPFAPVARRSGEPRRRPRASGSSRVRGFLPFAGAGARAVRSSSARSLTGACRPRRTLQPVRPRSRDERCPSGSGWGSSPSRRPARADGSEPSTAKAARRSRWTRASARPAPGP